MTRDLDVGMKCIKYMLFVSNFMFVMLGFLLISVGSTIRAIYGDFEVFMESHYFDPAALLVAIGVIVFFIAIFGCAGAIRESVLLVNVFSLFLSLVLILEIATGIAAYAMRNNIYNRIEINMDIAMGDYASDTYAMESWDFMQERLQCCGIHSPMSWEQKLSNGTLVSIHNETAMYVPNSCVFASENTSAIILYEHGCLDRLAYIISEGAFMLGTGAICVAFVQFLGVIFAHMLAKAIRRIKTEEEMRRQEYRQRMYEQLARGQQENEKVTPVLYTASESAA